MSIRQRMPGSAFLLLLMVMLAVGEVLAAGHRLGTSGLPLPRWASLASSRANLRTGPGRQFPVRWIFVRRGLPLRVVDEVDVWRRVEAPDGEVGWMHAALLSSRRTVMVRGAVRPLRRTPAPEARVVARLEPGVIARLLSCDGMWCLVEVESYRGWLRREEAWGVDPAPAGEAVPAAEG